MSWRTPTTVVNFDAASCKARPVTVHPVTQAWSAPRVCPVPARPSAPLQGWVSGGPNNTAPTTKYSIPNPVPEPPVPQNRGAYYLAYRVYRADNGTAVTSSARRN
jgi:hypothetical protein